MGRYPILILISTAVFLVVLQYKKAKSNRVLSAQTNLSMQVAKPSKALPLVGVTKLRSQTIEKKSLVNEFAIKALKSPQPTFYYPKIDDDVDPNQSYSYYFEICKNSNYRDCHSLGRILHLNGTSEEAKVYYHKSCQSRNWKSCYRLGELLMQQDLTSINVVKKLFASACDSGNVVEACYAYGYLRMQDSGLEGGKAQDEAWNYMLVACEEHSAESCYALGKFLDQRGDVQASSLYFKKACALDLEDHLNLCTRYL